MPHCGLRLDPAAAAANGGRQPLRHRTIDATERYTNVRGDLIGSLYHCVPWAIYSLERWTGTWWRRRSTSAPATLSAAPVILAAGDAGDRSCLHSGLHPGPWAAMFRIGSARRRSTARSSYSVAARCLAVRLALFSVRPLQPSASADLPAPDQHWRRPAAGSHRSAWTAGGAC